MESSYFSRYNIVQTFKENEFQKVYVGTDSESKQAVVINNIYIKENASHWELDDDSYRDIFHNIIDFEKNDDEVVIVTKVEDGISLSEYLDSLDSTFDERINLIHKYLSGIKKYDPLPNRVKSILVDESQIIVSDGNITFGELIIFNEENFYTEDFELAKDSIISVLRKFTSLPHVNYNELPIYIKAVGFIDEVRKDEKETYNDIESILKAFEGLDIHKPLDTSKQHNQFLYSRATNSDRAALVNDGLDNRNLEDNSFVGQKVGSINENYFIETENKASRPLVAAIAIAGLATTVLVGMFLFKSILPVNQNMDNNYLSTSNDIVTIGTKDLAENEGAKDNIPKTTDSNSKIYYTSEYIEKDYENLKYNDYSYKITDNKSSAHVMSLDQGQIEPGSQFLMWMKSSEANKVDIAVEVYSNDKLTFKQSILYKPVNTNSWELVRFPINKGIDGPFDLVFTSVDGTIWIDKISIDMFK